MLKFLTISSSVGPISLSTLTEHCDVILENMCKSFFATNFKIGLEWGAINVQLSQFSGANALFQIDAGKQNSHLFLI